MSITFEQWTDSEARIRDIMDNQGISYEEAELIYEQSQEDYRNALEDMRGEGI